MIMTVEQDDLIKKVKDLEMRVRDLEDRCRKRYDYDEFGMGSVAYDGM